MRGYSEAEIFTADQVAAWREAARLVSLLADPLFTLRCHELARALAARLGLCVQDGQYGIVDHSWLLFDPAAKRTPREVEGLGRVFRIRPLVILDAYCVGRLPMVQLVCLECKLPHDGYRCGPDRTDVRGRDVDWCLDAWTVAEKRAPEPGGTHGI